MLLIRRKTKKKNKFLLHIYTKAENRMSHLVFMI